MDLLNSTVNILSAEIETAAIGVRFDEFWIQTYCCTIVLDGIDDFTFFLISDTVNVVYFCLCELPVCRFRMTVCKPAVNIGFYGFSVRALCR